MKTETLKEIAKKLGKQERTLNKPGVIKTIVKKIVNK